VFRPRSPVVALVAGLLIAATPLAACGGSDNDDGTGGTTTKTVPGAEVAPPPLVPRDRRAYNAIQRSSGALRAAAVPVAYGSGTRIVVADHLNALAGQLARTSPRNASLKRLRRTALDALSQASSAAAREDATAKGIAKASIAEADRIDAGLRRYAASHPAANG
jgi:hypothetical protein